MRDTGCEGVLVRKQLVDASQLTGECCLLLRIYNTALLAEKAVISLRTPFLSGEVKALCIPDAICDVIVGNVEGARSQEDPDMSVMVGAATTRAQAKREAVTKPLRVPDIERHVGVDREQLIKLQQEDPRILALVDGGRTSRRRGKVVSFEKARGIVYRRLCASFGLGAQGQPNIVNWGDSQERAYNSLKVAVTSKPVLQLPDVNKRFVLRTDASDRGLGAVLMQENEDTLFPVAYASKKLTDRERKYSVTEREALAIVWGVKKFSLYLYGTVFTLQTDHGALQFLNAAKFDSPRIMRWALALQVYNFDVQYIKGSENFGADYLSRIE
ncbi:Zinc finger protein [Plakobranchus ocellatus]|uniref:Zinc finger protein n=1 Tax=Plakobranchus ocellatus TaxID=259542 RepID=A0AAV4CA84_9GAST|nr:Zinc finger protein [Plakobranchus ocellatus]